MLSYSHPAAPLSRARSAMVQPRAQLSASRIVGLLLPSFFVVVALSTVYSFFSSNPPSSRRRLQLETPQQKGPPVELQPNAYRPSQEAGATLPSALEGSCTVWVEQNVPFNDREMRPADRLPAYIKGHEPSICDWPNGRQLNKTVWGYLYQLSSQQFACGPNAIRYKLYKGVLYRDRKHVHYHNEGAFLAYAPAIEELVLLALYLYPGLLPNMDFIVDYGDGPNPSCVAPMLTLARDAKAPTGCVLPVPRMWQELSASRTQMEGFLRCLDVKYGGEPKLQKVLWRGSTTGGVRLLPENRTLPAEWKARLLYNPRLYAAILARNYDWMDVGITDITWRDFGGGGPLDGADTLRTIEELLAVKRPYVSLEDGSRYAGTLVLEGHGFLGRLAPQLLLDSINLIQDRPVLEWCMHRLVPGVHYLPLRHDLADMLPRAFDLTQDFASGRSQGWSNMVANARGFALDNFNLRSMVDAAAWALVEYQKRYVAYEVDSPDADTDFEPIKHYDWRNPYVPQNLRKEVEASNPANFEIDPMLAFRIVPAES